MAITTQIKHCCSNCCQINSESKPEMNNDSAVMHSFLNLPALYVIGFSVLYLRSVLSITTLVELPDALDKSLLLIASAFLLLHCVSKLDLYSKHIALIVLSVSIGFISYLVSGETASFVVILAVLSTASITDIDCVVRYWLFLSVALMLFLITMFAIQMVCDPQGIKYFSRLSDSGLILKKRWSFYFSHPNMFGAMVLMSCSAFVYLYQNRIGFIHYFLILLIALFVFALSDSKTSSILICLLVVLSVVQRLFRLFDTAQARILVGLLPLGAFLIVYLVSGPLYTSSLGGLLTGRISLWHACYVNQGLSLFGNKFIESTSIGFNGWTYYYTTLDCAYASGLFVLGIAFSLWFVWAVWKCARWRGYDSGRVLPALIIMLVLGFSEVHIFTFAICYVNLFLGRPLFEFPERTCIG